MRNIFAFAITLFVISNGAVTLASDTPVTPPSTTHVGWLFVATPHMPDPRFAETVIFMVRHDRHGALGNIVNRPIATKLASTLVGRIEGNDQSAGSGHRIRIHYGGPTWPSKGMFVHSPDYAGPSTRAVTPQVLVTVDLTGPGQWQGVG